ncbi:MAG: hypothetical protein ABIH92_03670 [Nanoarchaeota archaeon]
MSVKTKQTIKDNTSERLPSPLTKETTIVHLGDLSLPRENPMEKTRQYGFAYPNVRFIEIDKGSELADFPPNCEHITADFKTGLERLDDESVWSINSNLALGIYDEIGRQYWRGKTEILTGPEGPGDKDSVKKHTRETLEVAHRKLRNGGKLNFSVYGEVLDLMRESLEESPFENDKFEIREFEPNEYDRTHYTRVCKRENVTMYQITARK